MRQQRSGGVDYVNAVRAIGLHELCLACEFSRRGHVRHHEKSGHIHSHRARSLYVLLGDIGLGAMCGDTYGARPSLVGFVKVFDCPDSRNQENRNLCALDCCRYGRDPFQIRVGADSIVETGAGQTVAVSDLDRVDTRCVQSPRYGANLLERISVPYGVHAIA